MKKTLFKTDEKGMASVFAIMSMAVILSFSIAIYLYSRNEQLTANRFILGLEVKQKAQDGLQFARSILNNSPEKETEIKQAGGGSVIIFSDTSAISAASCTVYAKEKTGGIVVLSVAGKAGLSSRAVGYFKKIADGRFVLDHAEK